MSLKFSKILKLFIFLILLSLLSPSSIDACTYEATITGNHLDFRITSDRDHIQFVQFMHINDNPGAPYIITSLQGPTPLPWAQYLDGTQTYSGYSMVIQNRKQTADAAYWVSWIDSEHYLNIPPEFYGIDFSGTMQYSDISLEYGTMDENGNFGIGDAWQFCTRTGEVNTSTPTPPPSPIPTETPSPSPSPTPTSTPTPTPTSTPFPITKVFIIPGMGASWNVDALINCKDSGYSGSWTLAPYAKNVYDQILSALPFNNWDTIPFYYDWRQDVRNNANILNDLVNLNTSDEEKINLVGHSMGGLVGRAYLESQNGGKAAKFFAVGSPNQGSALAYPAIVNGEVWTNDLIEKIATTLLVKHCGIPDSLNNLLPTYNYLRDIKTKQLKDVTSLNIKNNYLPTDFSEPFWGVKVGTLAGTGFPTLKIIDVINNPHWLDGKPTGKENVYEGDGTVLVDSAQISGAHTNKVINQSHSGVIASTEGVNRILEFLGSPGIDDPPYSDPKSALVLVGYPGNFWVKDKNEVVTQSENGMIALINPQDGDYQLEIIPSSSTTTFIVGQFFDGGKIEYKEYRFKGLKQRTKIVEFNSKHPKNDCLHDKDNKRHILPKIKFDFWNWNIWNKF